MKFVDLQLAKPILKAVAAKGYQVATPIQAQTIPHTLAGRDVLGCAQTGTGKTAAFALPILQQLVEDRPKNRQRLPRALVLAPTRELAQQIAESFQTYGKHSGLYYTVIYGGVAQNSQVQALRRGVDIVIATPGRLLDLINQKLCELSAVRSFVLDEGDRMLDMGFMPDIKRIISHLPDRKQTLLFSATIPREIRRLADSLLHNPAEITVASDSPAVERIEQSVYHVNKPDKLGLLAHLMDTLSIRSAIVFTRTKHAADRVARHLKHSGTYAEVIHGNKTQNARRRALDRFRQGKAHVLVATDIAARGIDVDGISHVFNYDMCRDAESHIHRIGRTARAGAEGTAISFCDREEMSYLRAIERLIRMKIEVIGELPKYAKSSQTQRSAHPMEQGTKTPRNRSRRRSYATQNGQDRSTEQAHNGHQGNRMKKSAHRGQSNKHVNTGRPHKSRHNASTKSKRTAIQGSGATVTR